MNNYYKNKVKWCLICAQGWVEIKKEAKSNKLILCCSECESTWQHPDDVHYVERASSSDELLVEPNDDELELWEKYIIEN
ncbi:hypothetical protein [Paenibacillus nanensis]|uniref:hypothetical protein n=1 Tax=Paenibacillus nanensis TaxID=393251 RepID=UPI0011C494A7|nr:hypothetical protein [Paenibacillus nanensis]